MRTSPVSKWRRGFTLIEMVVVITIIALLAAVIAPNVVAIKRSRELRDEQARLLRLPTEARNQAVKAKATVSLRVDGDSIVMEQVVPQTSSQSNGQAGSNQTTDVQAQEVKRVPIGQYLTATGAQTGSDTSDLASWKWQAYPDGTSDSGGLTFRIDPNGQAALWMPADGEPQWTAGDLPQPKSNSWAAGDIVQRVQTSTSTTGGGAANAR